MRWNPSCEANIFAPEKWPFKWGGLSSGVEINISMFRLSVSSGFSREVGLSSGGLSKGVPLYMHISFILLKRCGTGQDSMVWQCNPTV